MSTLTHKLAKFTVALCYDDIHEDARVAARRFIFDSVGCALGGLKQEDPEIYAGVLRSLGGNEQATIIGTTERMSLVQATLVNALLIRVMDYNDIYWMQDPSHPSDIIPAALCVGEHLGSSGRDILTAIVIAYEIEMRLCEFAVPGLASRNIHAVRVSIHSGETTGARRRPARPRRGNRRVVALFHGLGDRGKTHDDEKYRRPAGDCGWRGGGAARPCWIHRSRARARWQRGFDACHGGGLG
ncbi:MAG: MmgE/PrpD family protein [Candidatus Krumholzibacteriota bacterium]|nr:MmgE/PrpD family protein [Candidatus Krumholzibacteriota bacterium]